MVFCDSENDTNNMRYTQPLCVSEKQVISTTNEQGKKCDVISTEEFSSTAIIVDID